MKLKKNKKLIIILVILLVLLIIVNIILELSNKPEEISEEEILAKQEQEIAENKLSQDGEIDRIEYYLSEFIANIENKNWTKAYELLYDEFKNNYFPTENSFQKYCQLYFPQILDVQADNIERINNIYVIETTIADLVNGNKKTGKINMYFVIKENDLNDFDLSFSVNSAIDNKNK